MYTGKDFSIQTIWHFARKNLYITFFLSLTIVLLYKFLNFKFLAIPFIPVASVGTAVAFYVGFKNNQAYDRLWEARKLWGGITNSSRNFSAQILALIDDKEVAKDLLYRHIAYINVLRLQLRKTIPWATSKENLHQNFSSERLELELFEEGLLKILSHNGKEQYFEVMKSKNNAASFLLQIQIASLTKLKKEKKIDEYEHSDLVKHINEFFNLQGGCERIKTTPLFRQYSIFSRIFVVIFITLVPFGLIKELSTIGFWGIWLTIPFSLLISWVFFTMEQIGEFSENPFDNSINDIPISAICVNIEIDIKEMLGEANLPQKMNPQNNILL